MSPRVAILDYGCGNLASVANAVRKVGGDPRMVGIGFQSPVMYDARDSLQWATHIILPGQGRFQHLDSTAVMDLNAARDRGQPILGICLGMQLMCEGSEEAPGVKGLGWLPLQCERLPIRRLPHIGWNTVRDVGDFYFCHSYAPLVDLDREINEYSDGLYSLPKWTTATEDVHFYSMIRRGTLWAVQFHPEKSGRAGLALLAEFLTL